MRDYLRVSGKLLGLVYEEGALTQAERQAIVSFAREIERKSPSGPLSRMICPWFSAHSPRDGWSSKNSAPPISRMEEHCDLCESMHAEPTVIWTLCGCKMTPPQVHVWACLNLKCGHEWPREITSPVVASLSANVHPSATQHLPKSHGVPILRVDRALLRTGMFSPRAQP